MGGCQNYRFPNLSIFLSFSLKSITSFKLLETRSAKFWQCFFFAKNTLAIHYPKTKHQTVNYCQTQFSTWKDKTFVSYLLKKLHKFSKQYYSRNEINLRNGRTWWRWTFWDFSLLGMFLDFFYWRSVSRVKDGLKVYLQKLCSLFSLVDHIFPFKNYLIGISIDSQWMLLLFGTVNHSFQYFFPLIISIMPITCFKSHHLLK